MKKGLEYIDDKTYNRLKKSEQDEILEYRRNETIIKRKLNSIEKKKNEIKNLQTEIRLLKRKRTSNLKKVRVYSKNYQPHISIVSYTKKGNLYFNCNVKIRGKIKSIYLGSERKMRTHISSIHNKRYNMKLDVLKRLIEFELIDNVYDEVILNYRRFIRKKYLFEDLI
tara:strand:+ start:3671 stop:4174 length:504 start_codon:yes stop_codon:yes gene_type:complete